MSLKGELSGGFEIIINYKILSVWNSFSALYDLYLYILFVVLLLEIHLNIEL